MNDKSNPQTKKREKALKLKPESKQKSKVAAPRDRLELLFTIVNRNKAEYYIDLLHSFDINMQLVALGQGTADANMLAVFGLNDTEKAVLLGVIRQSKISDALEALEQKFNTIKNGKGIAYTVPLTGVIGTLIFGFLSNNRMAIKDRE